MPKRNKTLAYKFFASFLVILVALAVMPVKPAYAAACNATVSGSWNTIATWSCGHVPTSADDVTINATRTVSFDAAGTSTVLSLTVNGTLNFNNASGNSLTVSGNVTNAGTIAVVNQTGANTHVLSVGGNFTNNSAFTSFSSNDSLNVVMNGAAAQSIGGTTATIFNNLTISNTTAAVTANNNFSLNGTMTVNTGATFNASTFVVSDNNNSQFILSSGATLGIGSTAGISGTCGSGNIQTGSCTYNAGANYVYNGAANQNTGSGLPNNLTGTVTINNPGFTVTLNNGKTIASGGTVNIVAGTFAAGANLSMASTSNITRSGGSMTGTPQGAGFYNVAYTGNSMTTSTELAGNGLNNVTVNLTSGQTLTLDQNRVPDGNLSITSGTFDLSTFTINRSAAGGTLAISNGAALKIGGANGFPTNYTAHTLGATSTVEYAGANQNVSAETYGNLIFSGSGLKSMIAGTSVGGNLSIAPTGTAKASVGNGLNLSVNSLTLGGLGKISGTWGSTISPATNQDNNYFNNITTGILTVTTDTRSTQTINFTSIAPASATYGGATYTPAASSTSGLAVTITVDATASSVCSISGGVVSFIGVGNCVLNANQSGNTNYNAAPQVQQSFAVGKASQTISFTSIAPASATYGGATYTPTASSTSGLAVTITVDATASSVCSISGGVVSFIGVGNCVLNANQPGNTNYNAAPQVQQSFAVGKASQTISFTSIVPASATYGGATYTPTASSTSGLAVTITVDATASSVCSISGGVVSFIGVGNCVLNANQPGNTNYNAAPQVQQSFGISQATLTITASSPSMPYGGPVPTINPIYNPNIAPSTPPTCSTTATVSSAAGTSWPSSCSGAADPNYSISYVDGTVAVNKAGQTIAIATHAPSSAISSATFPVAATASSSLPVAITATGVCSGSGSGSAVITMAATVGTCVVHYNQPGDSNYNAAPEKTEDVATLAITSADHATFTVNSAGTFTVTTNGAPTPSITETPVSPATLPAWLSFLDNGNGTATLSGTPPTGSSGAYTFTFKASNGALADATQNFTLTVSGGPVIGANGVNTIPDTGNGHLAEFEVVTVGIAKFTVTFSQDVINVPSTDPNYGKSAINPANYMLVNDNGNGFQTVDCKAGLDPQDFAISIDTVAYNNNGGAGPFIATLNVNSGLPLSNGNYRLYACGTTSITNLGGLKLAGDGRNEGADFIRNFIVQIPNNGGGGNGGGSGYQGGYAVNLPGLIPVTGFAPGRATLLPAQTADSAYSSNTGLRMEIPALGVNVPIVGVAYKNNNWDLTWLEKNAGYLSGSAFPTWSGNSVLTGHVTDASGAPGPFAYIKDLQIGDKIKIHFGGQVFIYEVRENRQILPTAVSTVFQHENYNWLTLVTCEDYNIAGKTYNYRRYARAALISVIPEK